MYAAITLLSQPYSTLTYALPDFFPHGFWARGLRVAVPLGASAAATLRAGYIESIAEKSDLPEGIRCKDVVWPLERAPLLKDDLPALAHDLALRQGIAAGVPFGHVLPVGLRTASLKVVWKDQLIPLAEIRSLAWSTQESLAKGFIRGEICFASRRNQDENIFYSPAGDPPWPLRPAAKKQIEVMDFLYSRGMASRKEILHTLGGGASPVLRRLVEAGLAIVCAPPDPSSSPSIESPPDFTPNAEQGNAIQDLINAASGNSAQCRLIHGVTGSGKTAVYLELARHCLEAGKSVMLLAPEVALAHKLRGDVTSALPATPLHFYHGYQQPQSREKTFRALADSAAPCMVVGTRSALYLPVHNLGCIILDEEHDASFKQDEGFAYHAKEVAWFRMKKRNGLLVLGSATPDIKTYHASQTGDLPVLALKKRVAGNSLPEVELVNIGRSMGPVRPGTLAASGEGIGILSPQCEEALRECASSGSQAVILLNRRGYSPLIYCSTCAKILHCPNCAIGLAYHKSLGRLICHYCGYSLPWPSPCPECGKTSCLSIGEGTERLTETLEAMIGRPVLRLDRDSARRPGRMEEILAAFHNNESPFLVGTQMLSKGHHFPNVTLVVAADGDIGLNLPDYRAAERTFQLLVQSGGRAGRGEKPGRILIQTRNPDHYCWRYVTTSDYVGFYEEELRRRKKRNYPPFTRLGLLRISFPLSCRDGASRVEELGRLLKTASASLGVAMLGPAPAPISLLSGRKRFHCLFKSESWIAMRQLYFFARGQKRVRDLRLFLDLDPVNML